LLKKEGYVVDGIHFSHGIITDENIALIRQLAAFLGIGVQFVDIKQPFGQLLDHIDIEICHQHTPNVCVLCARDIKFGYVMQYAIEHGYDYLATGHYVTIRHDKNGTDGTDGTDGRNDVIIEKARDPSRDQSYGFGIIPKTQLVRALTPLGSVLKTEIRANALALGIPFISKESRGLCFTNLTFNQFYAQHSKNAIIPGQFIGSNCAKTPSHEGQQFYTKGQKVHLSGQRWFVKDKLADGNIVVAQRDELLESSVTIGILNYMIHPRDLIPTKTYQIMVRYNADAVNCQITQIMPDSITVRTESPVYAPTPGQIGTIYDGSRVIVGGFIR
jgi:tRNA-specific 2-thiouridylase